MTTEAPSAHEAAAVRAELQRKADELGRWATGMQTGAFDAPVELRADMLDAATHMRRAALALIRAALAAAPTGSEPK